MNLKPSELDYLNQTFDTGCKHKWSFECGVQVEVPDSGTYRLVPVRLRCCFCFVVSPRPEMMRLWRLCTIKGVTISQLSLSNIEEK